MSITVKPKIHFIGICGVAMSALAIAFKKNGWQVTGSDAGFYPPVSTNLKNWGIEFYPGWHADRIGQPDLVVVGNVASSSNPEWLYVQQQKLNYKSYPEVVAQYIVKNNSIVCAGTYGKTSTTALLVWILQQTKYDPSYMFGGLTIDDFASAKIGQGFWSVLEGDEYKSARWDNRPKFDHYSPTHLLLTAMQWDHADIYPTEDSYFQAFQNLIDSLPADSLIVANEKVLQTKLQIKDPITYGHLAGSDYQYFDLNSNQNGLKFKIKYQSDIYSLESPILGDYTAANITACFALACQIGLDPQITIKAIANFRGLKRRLQRRGQTTNGTIVFDDIAHSPAKAKATLTTLKKVFFDKKIIAVFEPNTGNREQQSVLGYRQAFDMADEVIIPRLTKVKTKQNTDNQLMNGQKLAEIISQTHNHVKYMDNDNELESYLKNKTQPSDVVVFLGSHGFRGIIEQILTH